MAFVGVVFIIQSYYSPQIDPLVTASVLYTYTVALLVEKKLILPRKIRRIYENPWYDKLALLLYVPSIYLVFSIGYNYGTSFLFTKTLMDTTYSFIVGLTVAGLIFILNEFVREMKQR